MNIMSSELEGRLDHWIHTLREDLYTPAFPLHWEVCHPDHPVGIGDLNSQVFHPVEEGYTWGFSYQYAWFRTTFKVPEDLDGAYLVMDLQPGHEATVFVNGEAFGAWRADWIKYPHHFMVDNWLSEHAKAGDTYTICMEVYAGHYYTGQESMACAPGPLLPGLHRYQLKEGNRVTLGHGTIGTWDETAYQLFMDVDVLSSLLKTLDPDSLRAAKIADALEAFTMTVDFEQPKEKRDEDYRKARVVLRPALQAENGSTMPIFSGIGNAHLDLAWLWPMHETYRKTARTFAAQLRLLDKYPEYLFLHSMPACYEMCLEKYPKLYNRILKKIHEGRWIAEGAMWVEPDTNMAGAEALVRQILYGKKYYKEELGVDSVLLWLPDTFGYSAALPQILKKTGIRYMVTQKIFWSYNEGEPFPYHYFNWEGMDGSKVKAFLPTRYEYYPSPEEMKKVWKNRTQKRHLDEFLMPFGYGDGGGGPTRDHIELIRRQTNLEGDLKMKIESPIRFFERMDAQGGPVHTYGGELYFTAHRGTYTGQAMIKKLNRLTEILLRDLEYFNVLSSLQKIDRPEAAAASAHRGYICSQYKIETMWKELLLHQFHDILPGSSIRKVYEEAELRLTRLVDQIRNEIDHILNSLTITGESDHSDDDSVRQNAEFTFWNSLSHTTSRLIQVPDNVAGTIAAYVRDGKDVELLSDDGRHFPVYAEPDGSFTTRISADGLSSTTCRIAVLSKEDMSSSATSSDTRSAEKPVALAHYDAQQNKIILENSKISICLNSNGEITSFVRKETGMEFSGGSMNHFRLFKDVPRKFDAWDIDSNYVQQEIPALSGAHLVIEKSGGSSAVLRLTGMIGSSSLNQTIELPTDSEVVVFDSVIDWKETHRLLKVEAQTNILAENGINEIQFGYLERPANRSRIYDQERFEVCNHRYSVLCEEQRGFAVLNDCKYGISMDHGALALSLLTASACPDDHADRRAHHFRYAYTAFNSGFSESRVPMYAMELNEPKRITQAIRGDGIHQLLRIEKDGIFLESAKLAEDRSRDIILRLYEGLKTLTPCSFRTGFPIRRIQECDMLENPLSDIPFEKEGFCLCFHAFEIKTIRITPA